MPMVQLAPTTSGGKDNGALTGVENPHATHRTASIVEHPVLLQVDIPGHLLVQLRDDILHHSSGIVAMLRNRALRNIMQMVLVEDVESLEVLLDDVAN